ncbi:hypothetical protein [Paenibacillus sp. NEAU-GSW1]|uniref:hypothetical protein n=1 Tax=Paenibacillus sp. NEAU-GSW1 TaxID=2682486 RepID=UPI0012E260C2|nr:hypothetical protein [Paenibacillus sp. NEAU-GSW1]MUT64423.1 hypothetical protein [Paenibacillus sp. NEAU-GSW1]
MDLNTNPRLAAHLSNDSLPAIDVTDKVMEAIRVPRKKKPVRKTMLAAGIAAAILVVSGFGYAASWQLHKADGTVSLEYRNPTEEDGPWSNHTAEEMEAMKQKLQPGEAGLFYDKSEVNPFALENPIIYTDLKEMDSQWTSPIAVPETIANDVFRFKQGNYIHEMEMPNTADEPRLREEAAAAADGIAFTLIKTYDIMGAHKEYTSSNGGQLGVFISPGKGWGTIITELKERDMIKTKVNGREAFAIVNKASGDREVVWMDERDGVPVYCKVSSTTPELVSQEQLIAIAGDLATPAS